VSGPYSDLGSLLADAGAVVSGSAALGATVLFVGAIVARELGLDVEPLRVAEYGAAAGVVGLATVRSRALGV
jgi:hypothetical protein